MKEKLGDIKLDQTLTNVVIPTFDIKRLQPTVFSTYEVDHLHPCNVDSHQIILYHILQFLMFFFFFFRWRKTHQLMLFSQIYALQLQLHQLIFQPTVSKPRMQRAVLWGNSILLMEAWLPIILYDHLMKFDLQHQRFVYIDVSGWFFWFCLISRL